MMLRMRVLGDVLLIKRTPRSFRGVFFLREIVIVALLSAEEFYQLVGLKFHLVVQ